MPCKPCEQFKEERITLYMQKLNLSREQAENRFKKIKPLIDKTVKKPSRLWLLKRWIFQTNWKATILNSFMQKHLLWIGKGFNPDYTLICTQGTCADTYACTKEGYPCTLHSQCADGVCTKTGSCGCPSPLPNSVLASACTQACTISGICARCISNECQPTCSIVGCSLGTCGYNCIYPYVWNGVACVLLAVPKAGLHPSNVLPLILDG